MVDLLVAWLISLWQNVHDGSTRGADVRSRFAVASWLFNPFTFAISTRGSCDSVTVFGLIALLLMLRKRKHLISGILWGLCIHWRVFPVIYGPAILAFIMHDTAFNVRNLLNLWPVLEWLGSRDVIGCDRSVVGRL